MVVAPFPQCLVSSAFRGRKHRSEQPIAQPPQKYLNVTELATVASSYVPAFFLEHSLYDSAPLLLLLLLLIQLVFQIRVRQGHKRATARGYTRKSKPTLEDRLDSMYAELKKLRGEVRDLQVSSQFSKRVQTSVATREKIEKEAHRPSSPSTSTVRPLTPLTSVPLLSTPRSVKASPSQSTPSLPKSYVDLTAQTAVHSRARRRLETAFEEG